MMTNKPVDITAVSNPAVGRPREFDYKHALHQALKIFWQKGYEGASMPDLTRAMGINKPSLYGTFGNKEQLFLKVVALYQQQSAAYFYQALNQQTAYEVAKRILFDAAAEFCKNELPRGCLIVQSALVCSESAEPVKNELIRRRNDAQQQLVQRFEQAKVKGDLAPNANPSAMAGFLFSVLQGMSVQAVSGVGVKHLNEIASVALLTFSTLV